MTCRLAGIVELRSCKLNTRHADNFLAHSSRLAPSLLNSLLPLRLFTLPETGAGCLHTAKHLYHYPGGLAERAEVRKTALANPEWREGIIASREFEESQESVIYREAEADVLAAGNALGAGWDGSTDGDGGGVDAIYEYRVYQLRLGYDTVPKFYHLYGGGLPSKVANQDDGTRLITVMHTEVGRLNEVVEVWRHEGFGGMAKNRELARGATEWRGAIAEIADLALTFSNSIEVPTSFSPWK